MTLARIQGGAALLRNLKQFGINADKEMKRARDATAFDVQRTAVKSIQASGTGRVYERRSGQGLSALHRASAPGEPPASDTGTLANSVAVDLRPREARVGTNIQYGPWLEFGTQNMAERPWLRPALAAAQPAFRRRLDKIVDDAVKGLIV